MYDWAKVNKLAVDFTALAGKSANFMFVDYLRCYVTQRGNVKLLLDYM